MEKGVVPVTRVVFDDDAAEALRRAASDASDLAWAQEMGRRSAVETAVEDFSGGYANLFTATAVAESTDRCRLSRVLEELATAVASAALAAKQERQRQHDLTAWLAQEEALRRREAGHVAGTLATAQHAGGLSGTHDAGGPSGVLGAAQHAGGSSGTLATGQHADHLTGTLATVSTLHGSRPSEYPVPCPPVGAAFNPQTRSRTGGGHGGGGTSSADPDKLRVFVSHSTGANDHLAQKLTQLQSAWWRFTTTCTWVPLGPVTFLSGFDRLLAENKSDTVWIQNVANAFENAGTGTLPNDVVNLTVELKSPHLAGHPKTLEAMLLALLKGSTPDQLAKLLKAHPTLIRDYWNTPPDPRRVAAWWKSLTSAQQHALETGAAGIIGNLGGIPYAARNRANRAQLAADLKNPNLTNRQRNALKQLQKALDVGKLNHIPTQIVDYNMFGDNDAGNPLIAVSFGNLDTAQKSTWLAPGMISNADTVLGTWGIAATNLYKLQDKVDRGTTHADVAWLGYDTPDLGSVVTGNLAARGAARFASELDACHDTRVAAGTPIQVAVVAHSYGTTMAADALTQTRTTVTSYTMVGSAGLDPAHVKNLAQLHVARTAHPGEKDPSAAIYTTAATADWLAPSGAVISGRAEPNPSVADPLGKIITGAHQFSSDGNPATHLEKVTGHGIIGADDPQLQRALASTPDPGHGYFDLSTQSLKNMAATSTGHPELVDGELHTTTWWDRLRS